MSDVVENVQPDAESQPTIASIPNYSTKRKQAKWNGEEEEWMEVRYGVNQIDASLPLHSLDVRRVDMGDQLDLVEIASGQVENDVWLSLAIVAMSVRSIDGVPIPSAALSKAALKNTLRKIGPTGVRAVRRALGELDVGINEVSQRAAAGN